MGRLNYDASPGASGGNGGDDACGNGGVDYGEACDCGASGVDSDGCCDCDTCQLKGASTCAAVGLPHSGNCCDTATCTLKAAGTACRAAANTCDVEETCNGLSPICPDDRYEPAGTACTFSDGEASTCYEGGCLPSLDQQCKDVTGNSGSTNCAESQAECTALGCMDGVPMSCTKLTQTYTLTYPGGAQETKYTSKATDGTQPATCASGFCVDAVCTAAATSCAADEYLETANKKCVKCPPGCAGCTGPSPRDCNACAFGPPTVGGCPISAASHRAARRPGVWEWWSIRAAWAFATGDREAC